MLVRCALALLGGAVLAAAFEPLGYALLLPVGVAAHLLVLHGLAPRRAVWPSLAFGVGFIFLVMIWMKDSVPGPGAWLAMCALEAAFFAPLGAGLALAVRLPAWPVVAAVWWVAVESVRSVWPLSGMPFGRLAFATAGTPWAEALPYAGATGVSLLVALTGTTAAWALLRVREAPVRVAVAAAGLAGATALPVVLPWQFVADGEATVAVVQGNVPGDGRDLVGHHREVTQNHVRLTEELAARVAAREEAAPDFVLWPENSTAVDPFTDRSTNAGITAATDAVGVPVVVGAMVDHEDPDLVLNQGIVWHPGRGAQDRYTKRHPVPFGEYIPFRDTLVPSDMGRMREISRDMVRGTRVEPLDVGGIAVTDAICFDVAYDEGIAAQTSRGGRMLVVQTSNAMFTGTSQIDQQFEITRLRAQETGRWVAVAAVNGVSGIVRPDGHVVDSAAARTEDVLVERVALSSQVTPAVRMGTLPAKVLVGLVVLHLLALCVTYPFHARRRRRPHPTTDSEASA